MIPRYTRPEIEKIWSDRTRYRNWLKVELAVCHELATDGRIPAAVWNELKRKAEALVSHGGVQPSRVQTLEQRTHHDVLAFTAAVSEKIGPSARYIHFGLTSSDVIDTGFSIQIQEAGRILMGDVELLVRVLRQLSLRYKKLATIGRTHGISAEPTSFGLKFLSWHAEWERNRLRLSQALEDLRFGKLSGAVGVNPHFTPKFEEKVLLKLGLKREPVSTQVIPRDRHACFLTTLAVLGGSIERIAVELRHLQRSEVGEVYENFSSTQQGSSAMPHKRNPISSENLTGCSRLLRSYAQAALENIALWHERDISHSSVERIIFPDATILLDYSLNRLTGLLEKLEVNKKQIALNLENAGSTVFSGHFLLALIERGMKREKAYKIIQSCTQVAIRQKKDFRKVLSRNKTVRKLLKLREIEKLGNIHHQLRHLDDIYDAAIPEKSE